MKPFWKVVFGGCLGTLIAFVLFNLIFFWFIGSLASSVGKEAQPAVPKAQPAAPVYAEPPKAESEDEFDLDSILAEFK